MWFRRSIRILISEGKRDEANYKLCLKFHISMAHADDIMRELDQYQWHVRRIPNMDEWIKKTLADDPKALVTVVKRIRELTAWGLLECKLYMEDVTKDLKPWPTPLNEEGEQ